MAKTEEKTEKELLGENQAENKAEDKAPAIDVEALLKKQAEEFQAILKAQAEANKAEIDAMAERNNKLAEELANFKNHTAEESKLLGESIAAIAEGKEPAPKYNPYDPNLLYNVHNETAGIDTIMTGDEVEGIIGVISVHLTQKLIEGAKEVEKHPYTITLLEKTNEVKDETKDEEKK